MPPKATTGILTSTRISTASDNLRCGVEQVLLHFYTSENRQGGGVARKGSWIYIYIYIYIHTHPTSEIVVYPTISEIVYQNIALYQMGRLEITKMVEE